MAIKPILPWLAAAPLFMNVPPLLAATFPNPEELEQMAVRFAPTPRTVDTSRLSDGDGKALVALVKAGRVIDQFHRQLQEDSSPGDVTREEFEQWVSGLPEKQEALAKGFFT